MKTPKKNDAKKIINDLYRKKHDRKDIVKRTFSRLYDERFKILESKSKRKSQLSQKSTISSIEKFESKIKEEYAKRKINMKTGGLASFIRKMRRYFLQTMKKFSSSSFQQDLFYE